MPQHARHSLINVLLLWTAVLSVVQVAFIIFYFYTAGHRVVSPPEHGLLLGKGKMLTFQVADGAEANDDDTRIQWLAKNPDENLISEGNVLTVKKDGYYFLNLQLTLCSCDVGEEHTVSLKWNDRPLLRGRIGGKSCTTGLGKVEELSAGGSLQVTVEPKTCIETSASETHLDVIYVRKP